MTVTYIHYFDSNLAIFMLKFLSYFNLKISCTNLQFFLCILIFIVTNDNSRKIGKILTFYLCFNKLFKLGLANFNIENKFHLHNSIIFSSCLYLKKLLMGMKNQHVTIARQNKNALSGTRLNNGQKFL